MAPILRIGIDIGGTFTDFVIFQPSSGTLDTFKLLTTTRNPATVVMEGLEIIKDKFNLDSNLPLYIIHGSTVATNALLEHKGARTALISTQGFRDIIQIGRQNRPSLYDLSASPPSPLVRDELRFEINERIGSHGEIITPLTTESLHQLFTQINDTHPESIAICLLFSFTNPTHEESIASLLREAGYKVSVSNEILPEYREYERASTTVVNAYVSPVLEQYLATLEAFTETVDKNTSEIYFRVMQSNGGIIRIEEAKRNGVRCILSGPAGGVIGALHAARLALDNRPDSKGSEWVSPKRGQIITFDMGGTSTDVSLIDGDPQITTEAVIGGYPIRIPVLDIHTIGAGGGSIAKIDIGGVMRVGPESAGADPGPACYGKGTLPTVTDANLVLGRLQANFFLGGQMLINLDRSKVVLGKLAKKSGIQSKNQDEEAALGIIEIINAHMERALRVISIERGHDPRDFTLLSFGGAGGLHAVDLARRLNIPAVIIPPLASTLSAFGMLTANVVRDYTQTIMQPGSISYSDIELAFSPMISHGLEDIQGEGISSERIFIERYLDLRYRGQSYEITIPFAEEFIENFHTAHRHAYGTSWHDVGVDIVNLRVRVIGIIDPPTISPLPVRSTDLSEAFLESRSMWFSNGPVTVPIYRGELISPGCTFKGPAVVVRKDTTILIGITDQASVDIFGNIHIVVGR